MELSNAIHDLRVEPADANNDELVAVNEAVKSLILMLTPFAPHICEELWAIITGSDEGILVCGARFPNADEEIARADELEIPVQVNGKLRSRVIASIEATNEELEKMALADEKVREHTERKDIVKIIVVPRRLVNIVVK
jgi:leucyl-tRNA synthetase